MAIQDYYNTVFTISKRTESKVNGRRVFTWTPSVIEYDCAIFTPSIVKTVRWDKQEFIIEKSLYCESSVPVTLGDRVYISSVEYDVVFQNNTNNLNHHYQMGLSSRG